jgi:DNA-binding protein H-NS
MATKKTAKTLDGLNAQIAKLQAQADALRAKEVAAVVARIREAITHYQLTAVDLGLSGDRPAKRPAQPKAKGKVAGKVSATSAKFTDGQGKTWSGIGKRPNWFKDALAAGKTAEQLLVKSKG